MNRRDGERTTQLPVSDSPDLNREDRIPARGRLRIRAIRKLVSLIEQSVLGCKEFRSLFIRITFAAQSQRTATVYCSVYCSVHCLPPSTSRHHRLCRAGKNLTRNEERVALCDNPAPISRTDGSLMVLDEQTGEIYIENYADDSSFGYKKRPNEFGRRNVGSD